MRIGLLGGTFNPLHLGHLHVAQAVLSRLQLSSILFVPTGQAPHKQDEPLGIASLPSRADRFKMVQRALKGYPLFKPCNIEIKRAGISYTIDTLSALRQRFPNDTFFFILGTDAFSLLSGWKEPEKLLELCSFVVVPRIGYPFSRLPDIPLLRKIDHEALVRLDRKERRSYVFSPPERPKLYFVRIPLRPFAASDIRDRIKTNQEVQSLLPPSVLSYIMARRLYT